MSEVFHTYYHSPVGLVRISGTEDYISEVSFRNKKEDDATPIQQVPILLVECTEQLIQYFNGQLRQFDLPLHQTGTPFQQDVWSSLLQIPFGKTVSYMEMAKRSGDIKAIRAIANANGKNNIAIIVPCHRVIGSNNSLVGYAGGLPRKKFLLDLEARVAHGVQTLF